MRLKPAPKLRGNCDETRLTIRRQGGGRTLRGPWGRTPRRTPQATTASPFPASAARAHSDRPQSTTTGARGKWAAQPGNEPYHAFGLSHSPPLSR